MREIMRTNDLVELSYAQALLSGEGIAHLVADAFTSAVEGSLGVLPRRLLVDADRLGEARALLGAAGMMLSR